MIRRTQPSVQKIVIIIKESAINDYLDKNKKDRETYPTSCWKDLFVSGIIILFLITILIPTSKH